MVIFDKFLDGYCHILSAELNGFRELSDEDVMYWSRFNRWPLITAIYLSMGLNPRSTKDYRVPKAQALEYGAEFTRRIQLVKSSFKPTELIVEKFPDTAAHGEERFEEPVVDTKQFIVSARKHFSSCPDKLFSMTLKSYKSMSHSVSGMQKGKSKDEVLAEVTKMAIVELEAGCRCLNPELARYLMRLQNRDGSPMYELPGIIKERYEHHFIKATNEAFRSEGIPLRNESKSGEPRGKKLCTRPNHN